MNLVKTINNTFTADSLQYDLADMYVKLQEADKEYVEYEELLSRVVELQQYNLNEDFNYEDYQVYNTFEYKLNNKLRDLLAEIKRLELNIKINKMLIDNIDYNRFLN